MSTPNVLHLYRQILRAAERYPSVKRPKIIQGIKLEFREKKNLDSQAEIANAIKEADDGLVALRKYSTLVSNKSSEWNWNLHSIT